MTETTENISGCENIINKKNWIKFLKSSKHYHTKPTITTIFLGVCYDYNLTNPLK